MQDQRQSNLWLQPMVLTEMGNDIAGVSVVGLEGDEKEKVVVVGDGVEAIELTNFLRKKVGYTDILSVAAT
ncbi:hypothetical protein K1719_016068 [Acacia pycnantha]|nr:hypothetical protein K1719_016068 [Acacia pycnantha]